MFSYQNKIVFSFLIGALSIVIGGVPFLNLKFLESMPWLFSLTNIKIALLIGGLMLLYDGFQIKNPLTGMVKITSLLAGIFLAALGAIPLLLDLGLINQYLPFIATLNISPMMLQGLLVFFGLYLIYDAYILSRQIF